VATAPDSSLRVTSLAARAPLARSDMPSPDGAAENEAVDRARPHSGLTSRSNDASSSSPSRKRRDDGSHTCKRLFRSSVRKNGVSSFHLSWG